jgi:hypothetical protein
MGMTMDTNTVRARRRFPLLGTLIGTLALLSFAVPATAFGAPVLDLSMSHLPKTGIAATHKGMYELSVSNTGDEETNELMTVDVEVPAGLKIIGTRDPFGEIFSEILGFPAPMWECTIAGDQQSVSCEGLDPTGIVSAVFEFPFPVFPIFPGEEGCAFIELPCPVNIVVEGDPGLEPGEVTATAEVSGGGAAASDSASDPTATWRPFDFVFEEAANEDELDEPFTQAGGRPHGSRVTFVTTSAVYFAGPFAAAVASEAPRDIHVELPPGIVGDRTVMDECSFAQLSLGACSAESQMGTLAVIAEETQLESPLVGEALYNMIPSVGNPAEFGFIVAGAAVVAKATLRNGDDYGVTFKTEGINQLIPVIGSEVIFWGVPADSSHDAERGGPSGFPERAFVSMPTSCTGPQPVGLRGASWQGEAEGRFVQNSVSFPGNTGCGAVDFSPTLEARPTTNVADSPSGLDVNLHIPQTDDPEELAEANVRDVTVTLPEGLAVNPSSANGLGTCSEAQFGFADMEGGTIHTTPVPATCPDASKLGSVSVETPALDEPVEGGVYLATPHDNPFDSLLAIYIAVADVQRGVVVKLAGEVEADPDTGQLSATFLQNPQLPFEDFDLNFFGGAGGALRTPATCGEYTTTSSVTPWTAPEGANATPSDTWEITQSPSGGACPSTPGAQSHAPSLDAGTVSPLAGSHSPFVVRLRREDGSQNFSSVTVSPPPGLVAKLAGTPACPDDALATAAGKSGAEEKASPSCPAASEVGQVVAGAGAGPAPYYAHGKAYLAGPYKGAPLSLGIVTPATAGPFDLGTVVVRVALRIDPRTAQITAESDPIPSILEGIPLDVRTVDINMDRPDFTLSPTSCDPMAVNGQLISTINQVAQLSSRFQLAECGRLGFKPRLGLRLKGGTKRGGHPALTAVLAPRPGDANIASISVALPRSEFLDQAHIGTVCTRVQFAASQCPAASIYGKATVFTPLLDEPLTGNVYLRSSDNKLPDLVPDLRGPAHQPIRLEAAGRTDSIKGGIRNTFDLVPDAPFTRLVLQLRGGNKGLLINSRNICTGTNRATVRATAHNGSRATLRPKLRARCRGKKRTKKRNRKHRQLASIASAGAVR